jgi:hypothetical protein
LHCFFVAFRKFLSWHEKGFSNPPTNQGCQIFVCRKSQFWYILEGLVLENVVYLCICIFCGRLVYFVVIWYILWSFGIFLSYIFGIFCCNLVSYGHLVYFVTIWYILWSFSIFCDHLVYFVTIWYGLWSFGIFLGHLVYFVTIWYGLWSFGIFLGHLVFFVVI